jgi:3-deoxy-D-manno-octulosonic-acid transferase
MMSLLRDAIYLVLAVISLPIWMVRLLRTGKHRTDWVQRFGFGDVLPRAHRGEGAARPRVLIHAVSVGEVNAAAQLVGELASSAEQPEIIIAATTDTGFARAVELFASRHQVVRYPFDISSAVRRFLDRVQPDIVVLIELEVWPNFASACRRRGIPLMVVNGRLSERSFNRYRLIAPLVRPMFASLHLAAVQTDQYAERFRALGTPADRVLVTDTMKWDTAMIADGVEGAAELAAVLGIDRTRPLIVAGSTAPGEHELLMRSIPDGAQLLCAPRKPEWFDQAAGVLRGCVRRSWRKSAENSGAACAASGSVGSETGRYLLDTIGELRRAYALADVVVVGRTFVPLGGSDMIEPIALGKATIVGPHVEHFQQTADALLDGQGLIQVQADRLAESIRELLKDAESRRQLAENGRSVICRHQGATKRHAELILEALSRPRHKGEAERSGSSRKETQRV